MNPNITSYQWSVDEYKELIERNIIKAENIQLVNGEILEFFDNSDAHQKCLDQLQKLLKNRIKKEDLSLHIQKKYSFEEDSLLSPDLSVSIKGDPKAQVLIEISDDSIELDQNEKLTIYADAKIPEYWIINLKKKQIEIHKKPVGQIYLVKNTINKNEAFSSKIAELELKLSVKDII